MGPWAAFKLTWRALNIITNLTGSETRWVFKNPKMKLIPQALDLDTSPLESAASKAIDVNINQINNKVIPMNIIHPNILKQINLCGIRNVITNISIADKMAEAILNIID